MLHQSAALLLESAHALMPESVGAFGLVWGIVARLPTDSTVTISHHPHPHAVPLSSTAQIKQLRPQAIPLSTCTELLLHQTGMQSHELHSSFSCSARTKTVQKAEWAK